MMEPARMAQVHQAAFTQARPWTAAEFVDLLASPHVSLFSVAQGFALTRLVADEAELLTLAVDPAHQRQGFASKLLDMWLQSLHPSMGAAFLEVATDNIAALALYDRFGFEEVGRRSSYYAREGGGAADAVVMRRTLHHN